MDRRASIIAGVWRVILTRGISGASVRAVADAAGVSLGLVKHYFPTKSSLSHASARTMIEVSSATSTAGARRIRTSALFALPDLGAGRINAVICSPSSILAKRICFA